MLPDRVSNPGPLTYESGALPIALRGPAYVCVCMIFLFISGSWQADVYMKTEMKYKSKNERELKLSKGKAIRFLCIFVKRTRQYKMIIMKHTNY